jgi:hypothetical protein
MEIVSFRLAVLIFIIVLRNRRPVKPIPYAGALSFGNLPPEIERKIKRAI